MKNDSLIFIPATQLPDGLVVPAFKTAKHLARRAETGALILLSEGDGSSPWVDISYRTALQVASEHGYALLAETQYLAIALQIVNNAKNWSAGAVGQGELCGVLNGAAQSTLTSPAFYIGDELIEEFGSAYLTMVRDNVQGDADGIVAKAFGAASQSIAPYARGFDEAQGIDYPEAAINWTGNVIVRSGIQSGQAGNPRMRMQQIWPEAASPNVAFRLVKQ